MNLCSSYIILKGVRFWSHHGVSPQETVVGNEFYVSLRLKVDLSAAAESDDLDTTVSYADVYAVLSEEMAVPSRLLEHVCGRVAKRLFLEFRLVQEVEIELLKRNPPMGADLEHAGVNLHFVR